MLLVLLIAAGVIAAVAVVALIRFGPRNVIGMLRYDRRRNGDLKAGERAPDVELVRLDGTSRASLLGAAYGRPLVIVFGSFT